MVFDRFCLIQFGPSHDDCEPASETIGIHRARIDGVDLDAVLLADFRQSPHEGNAGADRCRADHVIGNRRTIEPPVWCGQIWLVTQGEEIAAPGAPALHTRISVRPKECSERPPNPRVRRRR